MFNTNQSIINMAQQELLQTAYNIQTEIAIQHIKQQVNCTMPSGTYLYGSWIPAPQVCCISGPTKTNCCNCGASLRGYYRCEYCGTVNI